MPVKGVTRSGFNKLSFIGQSSLTQSNKVNSISAQFVSNECRTPFWLVLFVLSHGVRTFHDAKESFIFLIHLRAGL